MANRIQLDREQYLKIGKPRDACLLCGMTLNFDGKHPSLLSLSEKDETIRKDFCPTCWGSLGHAEYFSFWVTKRATTVTTAERRLAKSERNEALWRLFAALHAGGSSELGAQLFLLAHLLLRYKVLEFLGTAPDGKLRFRHPKLDEVFAIDDVPLDSVDFSRIKTDVEKQALEFAGGREELEAV